MCFQDKDIQILIFIILSKFPFTRGLVSDIVILESVYCNGTTDSRECDRACFFSY